MVCAGLLLTACQPASSQRDEDTGGTSSQQATPEPAKFSVSGLSIIPKEAKPGQQVSISVTVLNTGDLKGKYEVELSVNGAQRKYKFVILEGGESTSVTFTLSEEATGEYSVDVSGQVGSFVVE